jgi:hypothetical protein
MNRNRRSDDRKTAMGLGVKIDHSKQTHITKKAFQAGSIAGKIELAFDSGRTRILRPEKS